MSKPRVWNKRDPKTPKDAIYVGRPSKFGNPFIIGKHGNRADCIQMFRDMVERNPRFKSSIQGELKGHDLICWCDPQDCHATVLLEIANNDS